MDLQSFKQELLARVDIIDVIERFLPLKKSGANYSACCPFHSEKSPSFTVSPSKQFYHCFGCQAHGNAIDFLMQYSGLVFMDAMEELANGIGMQLPRFAKSARRDELDKKAPLTDFMAQAAKFYRDQLKASTRAIDYLKLRGLSGEIAARFGLGYAPDGWQNLDKVFADYKAAELAECGLVIDNEQGRRYDRFRDRIMFPILDQRGNVIGFGGRVLDTGEPKYLNSPETPLFEKGREVYGLPQARKAIHDVDCVIVVEGYMDVVGLAQLGVENVVATLGTATTGMHFQKLFRQANRVVLCFDRDDAGDKAARRAMETSLEYLADNKKLEILKMEGDQDPDEYIREHGKDAFLTYANSATRLSEFMIRELLKKANPDTAEGRAQLIHEAKPLLQRVAAPVLRVQLTKAIADIARLSQAEVEVECGLKPLSFGRRAPQSATRRPAARSIEHQLLENVLNRPERAARLPLELIAGDSREEAALRAIARAVDHGELSTRVTPGATQIGMLLEHFRGSEHEQTLSQYASVLLDEAVNEDALEAEFNDALERLRHAGLTHAITALSYKERNGGLSGEERQQLAALLAKKTAFAAKGQKGR